MNNGCNDILIIINGEFVYTAPKKMDFLTGKGFHLRTSYDETISIILMRVLVGHQKLNFVQRN